MAWSCAASAASRSFTADDRAIDVEPDAYLVEVCEDNETSVPFSCHAGACGTCATEVLEGWENLSPQTARERRSLDAEGVDPDRFRLACMPKVLGDVTLGYGPAGPEAESPGEYTVSTSSAPKQYTGLVESWRPLTLDVCEVRLLIDDDDFRFRPGQFMIVHIGDAQGASTKKIKRSYSISIPPSDRRHVEFCVRAVSGGFGSNYVHRLRAGDRVDLAGPYGKFVLDEESTRDVLMVATGTGAAPIKSMLQHLLETGSARRVRLLFGLRHVQDLFYRDFISGLEAHYPNFEAHVTLSQPDPKRWSGPVGRVSDLIRTHVSAEDAATTEAYLCGSKAMIDDVKALLDERGFERSHIHHENFY